MVQAKLCTKSMGGGNFVQRPTKQNEKRSQAGVTRKGCVHSWFMRKSLPLEAVVDGVCNEWTSGRDQSTKLIVAIILAADVLVHQGPYLCRRVSSGFVIEV